MEKIFHNYDVSFHNELWSSAFSGKFAAGTTWHWERVFWWKDALPVPPEDFSNEEQQEFTNILGAQNLLDIGIENQPCSLLTKRLHHHFRPLADFLNRPSVVELGIFNDHFTPKEFFDDDDGDGIDELECYYLVSDRGTAVGWVHNRNASVAKSFHVRSGPGEQNFLGCTTPVSSPLRLGGFFSSHQYYITWFPTRIGSEVLPPDIDAMNPQPWWGNPPPPNWLSNAAGELELDLTGHFNGVANNYLDTLRSDYAFVITPYPFVKSLHGADDPPEQDAAWDFSLYPNPTRDMLTLAFKEEAVKDVLVLDVSGRRVASYASVASPLLQIPTDRLAKGAYWVQVIAGEHMKTKKLIIH